MVLLSRNLVKERRSNLYLLALIRILKDKGLNKNFFKSGGRTHTLLERRIIIDSDNKHPSIVVERRYW